MVVLDDADLDAVVDGLRTATFVNAGQDCTAACRIIAAAKIHDELLAKLVPAATSLRVGDPLQDEDVELGPVITENQRARVLGFVGRAADGGADIVTGGSAVARSGFFVQPTIVAGVHQHDEIVQREVFGPVVTVQRAHDFDNAIALANDVEYGLGASVWTQNLDKALRATRELRFGSVWVNDHNVVTAEMPFGGYHGSGYGRDLSTMALEAYTEAKHVMIRI